MLRCKNCKEPSKFLFGGVCSSCTGTTKGKKKMKVSLGLIALAKEIHRNNNPKKVEKVICEFCLKEVDSIKRSKADPLAGEVCQKCEAELLKANPPEEKKEKKAAGRSTDTKLYPVRSWISKYIETHNGVTFNTLTNLMIERNYREPQIKREIKKIERDYEIDGKTIIALKGVKK